MRHLTTKRFWISYYNLSPNAQISADKAFNLIKSNPLHPSLQFKKVGKLYSARIDLCHRALALKDGDNYIWLWVGNHADYEKIIK